MSGPKVVRIVTKEEIEAICRGHMRAVSDAADALARFARRHDRLTAHLEQDLASRSAAFEKLFRDEKWMDIQKLGPQVELFLKQEIERLEAEVIAAAAAARCDRRRAMDSARSVALSLNAAGAPVSAELQAAAAGSISEFVRIREIVEQALKTIKPTASPTASATSRQLAQRLSTGNAPTSLDEWTAQQAPNQDPLAAKIDAALAELETIAGKEAAVTYATRADAFAGENERGRRALLADSLVLEVARAAAEHRAKAKELGRLRVALQGLETMPHPRAAEYRDQFAQVRENTSTQTLRDLAVESEAVLKAALAEQAAMARRRALLSGLAELGYEVRQSMTTALTEQYRLILRKPNDADYGVEISAPKGAERMQVRLVGAAQPVSPRDSKRDRDKEASWCGDVGRLRTLIGSAGGDFIIERAIDPGVELVKTVVFAQKSETLEYADIAQPGARTIG